MSRLRSAGRQIKVRSTNSESESLEQHTAELRVLSFNIAHGRGATDDNWEGTVTAKRQRVNDIAELIIATKADVIVLNEVDFCSTWSGHQNQAEAIAIKAGFPHWVEQRNLDFRLIYGSWKFGNAVLSRFPIVETEAVSFPALRASEKVFAGCKHGVICTLQISESQKIRILAVHLEHRSEEVRVASSKMIIEAAESSNSPLFAVGDFNSTPVSFPNSQKTTEGENALDLLVNSDQFNLVLQFPPSQQEMTYPSESPTNVIDWILIPKRFRFINYRTVHSLLSDHRPILADVEIPIDEE